MRTDRGLETSVERVLAGGVIASGVFLLLGLALGQEPLLRLGVVLLMLTPVVRVLVLTLGLFHEGDLRFGFVSLAVLAVLVAGIVFAHS